ncbi:MAG: hypothetical protein DYG92_07585 [Leptolyngbya sp. PLA1]|nr:hypothetical protein [Leptolyngbya sp. PLA1]
MFAGNNTPFGSSIRSESIVRADGVTTTVIATSAQLSNSAFNAPDINCDGEVAFRAVFGASNGCFKGTGGPLTTIATATNGIDGRNIDDDGTVAFTDNFIGVRMGNGGTPATIQARNTGEGFGTDPDIRGGAVVYDYFLANGDSEIRVFSGGTITTIATATSALGFVQGPRVSHAGDITFFSQDSAGTSFLNVYAAGVTTPRVDTLGPFFQFPGPFELNHYGVLAFAATRDDFIAGIYTGPNPATDAVIETGALLGGRTVIGLNLGGLNDRGQISFAAAFSDGTYGMYRADPAILTPDPCVPAPAGLATVALALATSGRRQRRASPVPHGPSC